MLFQIYYKSYKLESHWLADWNRQEPRYKVGEIVRFKVTKVSDLNNWGHVSNARNINFIN